MSEFIKTTYQNGRFCNQLIRNIATSILAENNNLFAEYSSDDRNVRLGIKLFKTGRKFLDPSNYSRNKIIINDNNFEKFANKTDINGIIDTNSAHFQIEPSIGIIYDYIRSNFLTSVKAANPYKERYNNNNDILAHVRLGDVRNSFIGLPYFINTIDNILKNISPDQDSPKVYIATDSPDDDIIKTISEKYNSDILGSDIVETIQFSSTCKNIITSPGSFSATIAYLSINSNVFYCTKDAGWSPLSLFTNKGFTPVDI